jgi:hypothetical protein
MKHRFFAFAAAGIAAMIGATAVTASQGGALAGRWTQSSKGSELVLVPKFKLQPNYGVTPGTSLGGTVGYGSMTRTTIVTDPVPLVVNRSMTLDIAADGRFDWSIVKQHAETPGGKCIKTTRTERRGRATRDGSRIHFKIEGGLERWEKSCGGSGSAALGASTEVYSVTLGGAQLRLVNGPTIWNFRRG